jgi:hypothetical protein
VTSWKWQGERIRLSNLDPARKPAACSQDARRFDEIGREVDPRHPATAFRREIARRATEAPTEIEHLRAGLYARTFGMLARCHDTSAVQLVERRQIAMAEPVGINTSGTECTVNPLHYRPISVIALNHRLEVGHARLLCDDFHAPLSHAARRFLPTGMVDEVHLAGLFSGQCAGTVRATQGMPRIVHQIHQSRALRRPGPPPEMASSGREHHQAGSH